MTSRMTSTHLAESSIERISYPASLARLMTFSPSAMNRPSAGSRLRRSSTSVRPV